MSDCSCIALPLIQCISDATKGKAKHILSFHLKIEFELNSKNEPNNILVASFTLQGLGALSLFLSLSLTQLIYMCAQTGKSRKHAVCRANIYLVPFLTTRLKKFWRQNKSIIIQTRTHFISTTHLTLLLADGFTSYSLDKMSAWLLCDQLLLLWKFASIAFAVDLWW